MFAAELAALDPDIQAVAIDVEGNVDLTGIESMPCLVHLLIQGCQRILSDAATSAGHLNLTRLYMPYAAGVAEKLITSPRLRDLEVDGGSLDMLNDLSQSTVRVRLRRVKSASDRTNWGNLENVRDFEILQSGKIQVLPKGSESWAVVAD